MPTTTVAAAAVAASLAEADGRMARVEAAIGQLIPASQLQIGPVIGRGGFSTVHSGMLHDPSGAPIRREPLAIKRIAPYPESESGLARLCREVSIMRLLIESEGF